MSQPPLPTQRRFVRPARNKLNRSKSSEADLFPPTNEAELKRQKLNPSDYDRIQGEILNEQNNIHQKKSPGLLERRNREAFRGSGRNSYQNSVNGSQASRRNRGSEGSSNKQPDSVRMNNEDEFQAMLKLSEETRELLKKVQRFDRNSFAKQAQNEILLQNFKEEIHRMEKIKNSNRKMRGRNFDNELTMTALQKLYNIGKDLDLDNRELKQFKVAIQAEEKRKKDEENKQAAQARKLKNVQQELERLLEQVQTSLDPQNYNPDVIQKSLQNILTMKKFEQLQEIKKNQWIFSHLLKMTKLMKGYDLQLEIRRGAMENYSQLICLIKNSSDNEEDIKDSARGLDQWKKYIKNQLVALQREAKSPKNLFKEDSQLQAKDFEKLSEQINKIHGLFNTKQRKNGQRSTNGQPEQCIKHIEQIKELSNTVKMIENEKNRLEIELNSFKGFSDKILETATSIKNESIDNLRLLTFIPRNNKSKELGSLQQSTNILIQQINKLTKLNFELEELKNLAENQPQTLQHDQANELSFLREAAEKYGLEIEQVEKSKKQLQQQCKRLENTLSKLADKCECLQIQNGRLLEYMQNYPEANTDNNEEIKVTEKMKAKNIQGETSQNVNNAETEEVKQVQIQPQAIVIDEHAVQQQMKLASLPNEEKEQNEVFEEEAKEKEETMEAHQSEEKINQQTVMATVEQLQANEVQNAENEGKQLKNTPPDVENQNEEVQDNIPVQEIQNDQPAGPHKEINSVEQLEEIRKTENPHQDEQTQKQNMQIPDKLDTLPENQLREAIIQDEEKQQEKENEEKIENNEEEQKKEEQKKEENQEKEQPIENLQNNREEKDENGVNPDEDRIELVVEGIEVVEVQEEPMLVADIHQEEKLQNNEQENKEAQLEDTNKEPTNEQKSDEPQNMVKSIILSPPPEINEGNKKEEDLLMEDIDQTPLDEQNEKSMNILRKSLSPFQQDEENSKKPTNQFHLAIYKLLGENSDPFKNFEELGMSKEQTQLFRSLEQFLMRHEQKEKNAEMKLSTHFEVEEQQIQSLNNEIVEKDKTIAELTQKLTQLIESKHENPEDFKQKYEDMKSKYEKRNADYLTLFKEMKQKVSTSPSNKTDNETNKQEEIISLLVKNQNMIIENNRKFLSDGFGARQADLLQDGSAQDDQKQDKYALLNLLKKQIEDQEAVIKKLATSTLIPKNIDENLDPEKKIEGPLSNNQTNQTEHLSQTNNTKREQSHEQIKNSSEPKMEQNKQLEQMKQKYAKLTEQMLKLKASSTPVSEETKLSDSGELQMEIKVLKKENGQLMKKIKNKQVEIFELKKQIKENPKEDENKQLKRYNQHDETIQKLTQEISELKEEINRFKNEPLVTENVNKYHGEEGESQELPENKQVSQIDKLRQEFESVISLKNKQNQILNKEIEQLHKVLKMKRRSPKMNQSKPQLEQVLRENIQSLSESQPINKKLSLIEQVMDKLGVNRNVIEFSRQESDDEIELDLLKKINEQIGKLATHSNQINANEESTPFYINLNSKMHAILTWLIQINYLTEQDLQLKANYDQFCSQNEPLIIGHKFGLFMERWTEYVKKLFMIVLHVPIEEVDNTAQGDQWERQATFRI